MSSTNASTHRRLLGKRAIYVIRWLPLLPQPLGIRGRRLVINSPSKGHRDSGDRPRGRRWVFVEREIQMSEFVSPIWVVFIPMTRRAVEWWRKSADLSVDGLTSVLPCCLFQDPSPRRTRDLSKNLRFSWKQRDEVENGWSSFWSQPTPPLQTVLVPPTFTSLHSQRHNITFIGEVFSLTSVMPSRLKVGDGFGSVLCP